MNLRQLEYFVHVAELGSFSKAALVLGIAQPALSRQVRLLETDLRETLLLRNGRGVALTEPGRRLFAHGIAILQSVAAARDDMGAARDEPVGRITIGMPPSIGRQLSLPLVEAFERELPRAKLVIVEGMSLHIVEWIATGRVDLGLVYNPEPQPAIEITPLIEEPLCLVSPVAVGSQGGVALRDLGAWPLILPERGHTVRRLLESHAVLGRVNLQVAWEVSSIAAIVDLVAAGHGHAVLHASAVAASGRADALVARPLVDPRIDTVLCATRSAHKRPTPLTRHAGRLLEALAMALPQGGARAGGGDRVGPGRRLPGARRSGRGHRTDT